MTFEALGDVTLSILAELAKTRVGALDLALVKDRVEDLGSACGRPAGEIERVAWLRATDQPRRVDASLLTENFAQHWSVRAQGDERMRQAHLLARARRQGVLGK